MKKVALSVLLFAFISVAVGQPTDVFARGGDDDGDRVEYRYDDDEDDDEDGEEDEELEVEADVYTDMTIVKIELPNGKKYQFSTDATTTKDIAVEVADRYDLDATTVEAVLEIEVEDRASRMGDRAKIRDYDRVKDKDKNRLKICRTDLSDALEVEADVFTDTTIVKVELVSGTKKVFSTDATTTKDIIAEVADRYDLDADDVAAVLDIEIENRASRAADRAVAFNPADCDDDRAMIGTGKSSSTPREAELRAQVAELERLLNTLIRLFTERFGSL